MIKTKKIITPIIYTIGIILIGTLINSILYYFNITTDKINSIILYLIGIISIFTGALKLAQNSNQKGIISGLIYFIFAFIIMIFLSSIVFKTKFNLQNIIYYIAILIFSVLGGIIGKNKKDNDSDIN